MLQILGIAEAKCSFSTVSGVKGCQNAANTRHRGGKMQGFAAAKCSFSVVPNAVVRTVRLLNRGL